MDLSKFEGWMKKSGWKGEGLGKNEDGLVKAIHVERKNNTTGIGATRFQWDNLWWDNVYSSTSIKIGGDDQQDLFDTKESFVEETTTTVAVKKSSDKMSKVELKEYKRQTALEEQMERSKKKDNLYFGTFTKATLTLEAEIEQEEQDDTTENKDDDDSNNNDQQRPQEKLNDVSNDVFLACQGRVLRKYTPIGKLQRLKDQEEGKFSVESLNNNIKVYKSSENKIETTKSKRKLDDISSVVSNNDNNNKDDGEKPLKKSKKEKKEKKKRKRKKRKLVKKNQVKKKRNRNQNHRRHPKIKILV
ncbi:hypothetical protein CYY_003146 [Polysphondylium violaceum]|uniref:G-patch domain-containing protein n=1 Tax=Polysphondylium violaceum TaxID=133409 RepID=A0A8J4PY65_9MYCE|nr:hypothetical protein CYY_003146 [Polysphondylium violaceum]